LMLEVHKEKGALSVESRFDQDVGVPPFVHGRIADEFFIGEFWRFRP
jgi:hypothetical protein